MTNLMPNNVGSDMMLLTDGTVMVEGGLARWYRLTPDITGSYIKGTWTVLAPMSTPRLDFASQVLPSGRVWVAGGEYAGPGNPDTWTATGEIYDPVSNSWSPIATFPNQANCFSLNQFGGAITKNSAVVKSILTTYGFETGWLVSGPGIPANTTIVSVDSSSQITLSQNATSNNAGAILSFSVNTTGNTTKNSAIVTGIPSTSGFQTGWDVSGAGIPSGATISSVDSATQIHISSKATATGSGVALTFGIEIVPASCMGDVPTVLLTTGQILVGDIVNNSTYLYDLAADTWTLAARRVYGNSGEQGWARLSDGRVLTYDIGRSLAQNAGYAELYNPVTNAWTSISPADSTASGVLPMLSGPTSEMGPVMRLQDGRMLQIGGYGSTAIYTPATNTWAAGPAVEGTLSGLPFVFSSDDAPAAILPNGHVIFAADAGMGVNSTGNTTSGSAVVTGIPSTTFFQAGWSVVGDGIPGDATITSVDSATQITMSDSATATATGVSLNYGGGYANPTELFDFDPIAGTASPVSPPLVDANLETIGSYLLHMLMLPTGQMLLADGSNQLWVYTPDGAASASLLPSVTSVTPNGDGSYTLTGTQLNGQSAGASYGDESQCNENYPIVRMVGASGNVYYAKTTNWSLVGVGTGSTPETVNFTLNPAMPPGTYSLIVSGAGLSSSPVTFTAAEPITIQTSPAGLQFTIDGGSAETAPQTVSLTQGTHTLAVAVVQTPAGTPAGTQYAFSQWSDSGAASHTITVGSTAATYTATFTTQYQLTTAVSPAGAGSVAASPSSSGFYNAGTSVQLTATANAGHQFNNWTGDLNGSANPQSISMAEPHSVTANFGTVSGSCSFTFTPPSASLPATGTSTVETCPNGSGQPNCGVAPETPRTFTITPNAFCGAWTATSSSPEFLQITSGAGGSGTGPVGFALLNNTHNGQQSYAITVASGAASSTYTVTQAGSGDNQVYREVYALYEQFLGRDPDPAGFGFWTGSGGAGLGQMADSFLTSPEAFNSDFVVMAAYQAAADAPPTFAQYAAAVSALRAGRQTVTGLFNSLINGSFTATTLYHNLLNRAPTAAEINSANSAGLAAWFQTLIGYPNNTTPVNTPNNEFQSTGTFHTDHSNALYMQMVYYVTLSRDPDPAGFAFWLGIANSGGPGLLFQGSAGYGTRIQILGPGTPNQGFIGSPEFQGLFAN